MPKKVPDFLSKKFEKHLLHVSGPSIDFPFRDPERWQTKHGLDCENTLVTRTQEVGEILNHAERKYINYLFVFPFPIDGQKWNDEFDEDDEAHMFYSGVVIPGHDPRKADCENQWSKNPLVYITVTWRLVHGQIAARRIGKGKREIDFASIALG